MGSQKYKFAEVTTSHPELTFSDLRLPTSSSFKKLARGIDLQLTYDGRGALFQIFSSLRHGGRRSVLLPAFHCPTVVEPAIQAGFTPRFYRVKRDLTIDVDDFLRCLDNEIACALAINYFGFPANLRALGAACRENRVFLIEDCAHSFLNANPVRLSGDMGDFAIYSFKKLVPSYVGGGIRSNSRDVKISATESRPPISDSVVNVKRMIDQAILQSDSRILANTQAWADRLHGRLKRKRRAGVFVADDVNPDDHDQYPFRPQLAEARIPWYANYILHAARLNDVVAGRQRNYLALRDQLKSVTGIEAVHRGPVEEVCPWALAVTIRNRSTLDKKFRSAGVPLFTFGETLHPALSSDPTINKHTISDARYLSSHLLCLSVHQKISTNVVSSVVRTIGQILQQT